MFLTHNYYTHKNILRCRNGGYFILEMNNLQNVFDTLEEVHFGDCEVLDECKGREVEILKRDWCEDKAEEN